MLRFGVLLVAVLTLTGCALPDLSTPLPPFAAASSAVPDAGVNPPPIPITSFPAPDPATIPATLRGRVSREARDPADIVLLAGGTGAQSFQVDLSRVSGDMLTFAIVCDVETPAGIVFGASEGATQCTPDTSGSFGYARGAWPASGRVRVNVRAGVTFAIVAIDESIS